MTHSSTTSLVARRSLRSGLALTGATLALFALAGCAPEPGAEPTASTAPSASATSTAEPSATATATAVPTETATPEPVVPPAGTAVDKSCEQLLSPDDVYAINPNLSPNPEYAATSNYAVTAATYSGISCGWFNQSSGETFEVALAMPNESLANTLKDDALSTGEIVPTYGSAPEVEGYFSADTTTAQVFTRGFWVTVTDPTLVEPGDAESIMSTVLGNI